MFSQGPFQVYQGHSCISKKDNHFHDKKSRGFSWKQTCAVWWSSNLVSFSYQRNWTPHSNFIDGYGFASMCLVYRLGNYAERTYIVYSFFRGLPKTARNSRKVISNYRLLCLRVLLLIITIHILSTVTFVWKDTKVDETLLQVFVDFQILSPRKPAHWISKKFSPIPPSVPLRQVNLTWLAGLTSAATVGIIGGAFWH